MTAAAAAWAAALRGRIRPVFRDRDGERFRAARAAVAGCRRVAVRESLVEFGNLAPGGTGWSGSAWRFIRDHSGRRSASHPTNGQLGCNHIATLRSINLLTPGL